ncbi:MAG TPA: tetratricopeptide repeat protein, partial [Candidatus Polarisedimenticolia bacterium]|nr:tetratricopeptide repeat protein [Candidatus Polarisedimenticolia bacterium]
VRRELAVTGGQAAARPDPRLASLARFDPPGPAAFSSTGAALDHAIGAPEPEPFSSEDERELAAARASLESGRFADAAGLLEDLLARRPHRAGLRLVLAYAYASEGEYEKARRQYALAHEQELGVDACWGLANAQLRLGDLAGARRELLEHVLVRRPDDVNARNLLSRIGIAEAPTP